MGQPEQGEAWIGLPSEEELRRASPGGGSAYNFGYVSAMAKLMAAHPTLAPSFREHFKAVMFGPSVLSRAEREMVAAVTSAAQECFY